MAGSKTVHVLRGVATGDVSDLQGKMKTLGGAVRKVGSAWGDVAGKAGQAAARMTAAGTAIGGAALAKFVEFEATMVRVGGVTKSLGTEDFPRLEEAAKKAGETTVFSASQSAAAMEQLGLKGFSTSQIIEALPGVLELAAAAQEDIAVSADIAGAAMKSYGLKAKDLSRINDTLVEGFTSANLTLRDLGVALPIVGSTARSVGVSLETSVAFLAKMADAGIQAETAGTALRNAFIRLAKPTKEAAKHLDAFGISINDDFIVKMRKLEEGLAGVTDENERLAIMADIFGQRSGPALIAVFGQGVESVEKLRDALEDANGRAKDLSDANLETLRAKFQLLGSKAEAVGLQMIGAFDGEIGDAVDRFGDAILSAGPALEELAAGLGRLIGAAMRFAEANPELVKAFASLAAAKALGITTFVTSLATAIGTTLVTAVSAAAAGFGALGASAVAAWTAATGGLFLVLAAVAALGYWVYEITDGFTDWSTLIDKLGPLKEWLLEARDAAAEFAEQVGDFLVDAWERLSSVWTEKVEPSLRRIWKALVEELGPALSDLGEETGPALESVLTALGDLLVWLAETGLEKFADALEAAVPFITESLIPAVRDAIKGLTEFVAKIDEGVEGLRAFVRTFVGTEQEEGWLDRQQAKIDALIIALKIGRKEVGRWMQAVADFARGLRELAEDALAPLTNRIRKELNPHVREAGVMWSVLRTMVERAAAKFVSLAADFTRKLIPAVRALASALKVVLAPAFKAVDVAFQGILKIVDRLLAKLAQVALKVLGILNDIRKVGKAAREADAAAPGGGGGGFGLAAGASSAGFGLNSNRAADRAGLAAAAVVAAASVADAAGSVRDAAAGLAAGSGPVALALPPEPNAAPLADRRGQAPADPGGLNFTANFPSVVTPSDEAVRELTAAAAREAQRRGRSVV